ncbi:MAG: right-handed parallel beta-helix repeat-containing protein [Candidatus Omnitrophica bacterium]|nr:right-handed parallel beta-helix repeat-containing protein [Candidatus Omnitrophota bacterium]
MKLIWLISLVFLACVSPAWAAGDGVLHLGATGYALRDSASVSDLDYTKDFSVEAGFIIEANTAGGRWAPIIAKTTQVFDATPGFALGLNQGQFESYGQQLVAKVADGTNAVNLTTPASYQGPVVLAMTFNAASKTLSFYVDGVMVISKANTALNLSGMRNAKDLVLGKGLYNGVTFGRDVYLARLWNRELSSAEVQSLATNFLTYGSHSISADVTVADLKSEWRMQQTSDSTGNSGTTHIKDTAGTNHLVLGGGAVLWIGDGTPVFQPADGAAGVSPAVVLRVSGGSSMISGNIVRPLSYNLQIDERADFKSANFKDSGWLINIASWKPVLKPGTTYYWRVQVRDASPTPQVSLFSQPVSFQTRAARQWYARLGVYTGTLNDYIPVSSHGVYGTQDGTSYANAWNGIRDIVWGENGVAAGDDLYVCGSHVYATSSGNFITEQAREYIKESGYSPDFPVTIRMDCPSDPGMLWGVFQDNRTAVTWNGPDINGVYTTGNLQYGAVAEMTAQGMSWMKAMTSSSWTADPGAAYFDSNTKVTSVKTTDGRSPAGKVYSGNYGFRLDLSRSSYVRFYKANFYNSELRKDSLNATDTLVPPSHHIVIDSSVIRYIPYMAIGLRGGHNNWTVRNSEIAFVADAIYLMGYDKYQGVTGPQNFVASGNKIHDTGLPGFQDNDCHGIGVQSGLNHVLENNEIYNTGGSAIELWTGSEPMNNMIIRNNFIHDTYVRCGTSSSGIVVSGDNSSTVMGLRTGIEIYGNIIMNTGNGAPLSGTDWHGRGIASGNKDPMDVYNNVMINTRGGISATVIQSPGDGPETLAGRFYNNMIINPWGGAPYMQFIGPTVTAAIDYNLFYPAKASTPGAFVLSPVVEHDQHSVYASPDFVSSNPVKAQDVALKSTSPAIDKGFDMGLTADFVGTTIPQGKCVDIGAFEYFAGSSGDVSGNGAVTMYDAALTLRGGLTPAQQKEADINGDATVDAADAVAMARKALGL